MIRAPKPWFRLLEESAKRRGVGRAERLRAIAGDVLAREAAEFAKLEGGESRAAAQEPETTKELADAE